MLIAATTRPRKSRIGAETPTSPGSNSSLTRAYPARLAAWIDSYASPEFQALADWCRRLVDRIGGEAAMPVKKRMEAAFLASSEYELAFWQMAWNANGEGQMAH